MGGLLENQTILLISPQPWDHIFISKHHYAEELARRNTVYFLEPPSPGVGGHVQVRAAANAPGVRVVSWRPSFPRELRFHAYWLYRHFARAEARRLSAALPSRPDVVWSFDFNLFPDLSAFGAPIRVFHPVDPLSSPQQVEIGRSAQLVVSVSEPILGNFSGPAFAGRTLLVNHGLAQPFAELAAAEWRPGPAPRHIGYFGNLERKSFDLDTVVDLARRRPEMTFHLWGPYEADGRVQRRLGPAANVVLHGRRDKPDLAREIACVDLFVLPYATDAVVYDGSNSHKILEYLSTGRPIVSRRITAYEDRPDLIAMAREEGSQAFIAAFDEAVAAWPALVSSELVAARKAFAKKFTYRANIGVIAAALSERLRGAA
jgi:glycosyltransferase involved in cell wall biosynthesis